MLVVLLRARVLGDVASLKGRERPGSPRGLVSDANCRAARPWNKTQVACAKRHLKVAAMSAGVTDASSVNMARDWNNSCSRGWRTVVRQFWPGWSHAWAASDPRRAPDWR